MGSKAKQYDLYKEMQKIRGVYAEFGNVELSTEYVIKTVSEMFDKKDKKIKLLDIGTNMGTLPHNLRCMTKIEAYGVECREDAVKRGLSRYPELSGGIRVVDGSLSFINDSSYDVVTMFDVIEHIPGVDKYIKDQVFRVLRPGGLFIFQTPNARINPIYECIRTKSLSAYKSYHCSLQTPGTLRRILVKSGFTDITIEKNNLDTDFNRKKISIFAGPLAGAVIAVMDRVPLGIFPNLWGHAKKPG